MFCISRQHSRRNWGSPVWSSSSWEDKSTAVNTSVRTSSLSSKPLREFSRPWNIPVMYDWPFGWFRITCHRQLTRCHIACSGSEKRVGPRASYYRPSVSFFSVPSLLSESQEQATQLTDARLSLKLPGVFLVFFGYQKIEIPWFELEKQVSIVSRTIYK